MRRYVSKQRCIQAEQFQGGELMPAGVKFGRRGNKARYYVEEETGHVRNGRPVTNPRDLRLGDWVCTPDEGKSYFVLSDEEFELEWEAAIPS